MGDGLLHTEMFLNLKRINILTNTVVLRPFIAYFHETLLLKVQTNNKNTNNNTAITLNGFPNGSCNCCGQMCVGTYVNSCYSSNIVPKEEQSFRKKATIKQECQRSIQSDGWMLEWKCYSCRSGQPNVTNGPNKSWVYHIVLNCNDCSV
jgi:hypothetical protein